MGIFNDLKVTSLQELSKKTLGRYIEKAAFRKADAASLGTAAHHSSDRKARGLSPSEWSRKEQKREVGISRAVSKLTKEETEILEVYHLVSGEKLISQHNSLADAKQAKSKHEMQGKSCTIKPVKISEDLTDEELDHLLENIEELDEVSKALLGRYIKAARTDYGDSRSARARAPFAHDADFSENGSLSLQIKKRSRGIDKAVNKLTKEELEEVEITEEELLEEIKNLLESGFSEEEIEAILDEKMKWDDEDYSDKKRTKESKNKTLERKQRRSEKYATEEELTDEELDALEEAIDQLDELSKKTLGRYIEKAAFRKADAASLGTAAHHSSDRKARGLSPSEWSRKEQKREVGISRAVSKLTKEETDLTESTVTPATHATRYPSVEKSIREVLAQHRNLREEAELAKFNRLK